MGMRRRQRSRWPRKRKKIRGTWGERRHWSEMPSDALSLIFEQIGPIEVLVSAQAVCRSWRRLAHEKETWRKVDFTRDLRDHHYGGSDDLETMAITAVDRSMGLMEEFSLPSFGNTRILAYMADRSPRLKVLRLLSCYDVSIEELAEVVKKLPLLEILSVTLSPLSTVGALPSLAQSCPPLKVLHLNALGFSFDGHVDWADEEAYGIAKGMPMLHELQLVGIPITNKGLRAILDECPLLESLDLRRSFSIKMSAGDPLMQRCLNLLKVRLPSDDISDHPSYGFLEDEDDGFQFMMNAIHDDFLEDSSTLPPRID